MPKIKSSLSRRQVLKRLALSASLSSLPLSIFSSPLSAKQSQDIKQFLALSSVITGIKLDQSYLQLGQDLLGLLSLNTPFILQYESLLMNFNQLEKSDQLGQEAAQQLNQYHAFPVQAILKAWYLSQVSLTQQDRLNPLVQRLCPNLTNENDIADITPHTQLIGQVSYDEALTWQACVFTKPAATCGGVFGYWADAPKLN